MTKHSQPGNGAKPVSIHIEPDPDHHCFVIAIRNGSAELRNQAFEQFAAWVGPAAQVLLDSAEVSGSAPGCVPMQVSKPAWHLLNRLFDSVTRLNMSELCDGIINPCNGRKYVEQLKARGYIAQDDLKEFGITQCGKDHVEMNLQHASKSRPAVALR